MSHFIQLEDIDETSRFVNTRHIAFIEDACPNCKVTMAMPGRDNYLNFAFLTMQSYAEVKRMIEER